MDNVDLKCLKKLYGENFAHMCRSMFPTILEQEGKLTEIITSHFAPSRFLYDTIISDDSWGLFFEKYINSFLPCEERKEVSLKYSPEELMDKAGYILYPECQNEDQIQSFKKYYESGEELCTFEGDRLDSCRVWFAVKKNVDEIKRENFSNPQRQDEYGTSVISIQFSRATGNLSIKNRYNHTVNKPDATFENNLDNIIKGLTYSFEQYYGISVDDIKCDISEISNLVLAPDGKYYVSFFNTNSCAVCENNTIIGWSDCDMKRFDKGRYLLTEGYLIDFKDKTINMLNSQLNEEKDSFVTSIGKIKDIKLKKDEQGNKVIIFTPINGENVELTINSKNVIIGYKNHNVQYLEDGFLKDNVELEYLDVPEVVDIGDDCLSANLKINKINLPKVVHIGNDFLHCSSLTDINMPNIEEIGKYFLYRNNNLMYLNLPKVKNIGSDFLRYNDSLIEVNLPEVEIVGDDFLINNQVLKNINMPKVEKIGVRFLKHNKALTDIYLPKIKEIEFHFLQDNNNIRTINLPSVETVEGNFICDSLKKLKTLNVPNLKYVGPCFLSSVKEIENLNAPKLENIYKGRFSNEMDSLANLKYVKNLNSPLIAKELGLTTNKESNDSKEW